MKGIKNPDYAASCLGVFLLMLKEKYTEEEIKFILKRKNVEGALKILKEPDPEKEGTDA